ncbi:MAG: hypothetical protein M1834_008032 [Cirrosporium novae-zelandiae]|nr:MAG: hypothetical protein M1834_008032 [Cirrosporium novae-zelandiae]
MATKERSMSTTSINLPNTAPYKPSPLSFGSPRSPRASPFRRPESPASPSTTIKPTTPSSSPLKPHGSPSPTKLHNPIIVAPPPQWTSRGFSPVVSPRDISPSPAPRKGPLFSTNDMMGPSDSISKLPPVQLREMREAFQVLDRDSDGQITREDVADALTNLGQDSSSSATSRFFPPGKPQTINLSTFLTTLSNLLEPLSSQTELLNAFAAFDPDDSGQIDLNELRNSLIHTAPEPGEVPLTDREIHQVMNGFTGRRAFAKGVGKRGDVFRYQDFVGSVTGGNSSLGNGDGEDEK